jgi:anti-sigma factor RsiW
MDCSSARELLPLYFDGELDRASGREFERHLDTCEECRAALIELDSLRTRLRNDTPRHAAPAALRERIARTAANALATPHANPRMRWLALAASWALAFVAGGALLPAWKIGNEPPIARDLFASHWRALAAASPVDVVSTDRHTVKPWFEGKVAQAPLVRDFAEQGFALVGGRIDYVGSARVPVLIYRHGQHLVDVFVLPPADAAALSHPLQREGYALEPLRLGDQAAVIVSDMDATESARFAQLIGAAK